MLLITNMFPSLLRSSLG